MVNKIGPAAASYCDTTGVPTLNASGPYEAGAEPTWVGIEFPALWIAVGLGRAVATMRRIAARSRKRNR